jgi:copper chaperone CopZ
MLITLKTKIPCENCSNSIKKILIKVPGVIKVDCSIEKSEICVESDEEIREILIEELKKTGRLCM